MSYAAAGGFAMPIPKHTRLHADFTGVQRVSESRLSEREEARARAEEQENGGVLADGLDRRYIETVPEAGVMSHPPANNDNSGYPDGNPKTLMGAQKPDLSVIPPIALLHLATAMMNGAEKYGPFNWRAKSISARPYLAALLRHAAACLDGEDFSADTVEAGQPVHHLAHVMACCAIYLDAESLGMLNDNRPGVAGKTGEAIEKYRETKRL